MALELSSAMYIDATIGIATYKVLDDDNSYYAEISGLQGVWAYADTIEECREELREVVGGWIELGIVLGHPTPSASIRNQATSNVHPYEKGAELQPP